MATLSNDLKRLIIQRLATFVAHSEIIAELRDQHGIELTFRQVAYYDPDSSGTDLAGQWRELHRKTREAFINDTSRIAVTHRAFRLQELADLYRTAKKSRNAMLAAQLLEQAAKEVGEAYTNKRILGTEDPMKALAETLGLTVEELGAAIAGVGAPPDAHAGE